MNTYIFFKRPPGLKKIFSTKVLGVLCLLVLLLSAQAHCANNKSESGELRKLTEQESWILGQIRQGKEADLKKRVAGEKENYSLDAGFLKQLFNGAYKQIKVSEQGVNIANATIEGDLDLDNVEINYPVYLKHCIFKGNVTFKRSYFKKDLSFEGSNFLKSANFKGIKIDGYFSCDGARFEDACFWNDAKIGLEFQARRAEFCSREAPANFNSLKAGDSIRLESAIFHGPVIFIRVSTGRQFIGHESKFLNPEKMVNFGGIITSNTIYLVKAEFHGPVNFKLAEIGMNLNATGAKFLNEKQPKNFSYMKIVQKAMFDETFLRGGFDFSYSGFYDLEIRGAQKDQKAGEKNVSIPFLNLKGTQVQRNLDLANVNIDKLNANQMKVKGAAAIDDAQINKLADFRGGSFQGLDFQKVNWPQVDQQKAAKSEKKRFRYEVYLGDLTFGSLSIDKPEGDADANPYESDYKDADFKRILDFVDECPFYTQSYVQVETFFKRIGRDSWANEVFMSMNNRELAEKMRWYDPRRWLEWFFWGKIAGYGRAPFRVFFLSIAFIILGACLFDPRFLVGHKIPAEGRVRSAVIRLIISLDRFLPIELGLAQDWDPKGRRFHVWLYFFLQQVLGWILIPIALASIYSQLK